MQILSLLYFVLYGTRRGISMYQQPPPNQPPNTYYPPQPMPHPPKKRRNPWLIIGIIVAILVLLASAVGYFYSASPPPLTFEQFRATAQETTVENLDKDGNAAKGANVFFTCKISSFVKDDSGNTAGANVNGTDTTTFAVVQVGFPAGTDISKVNQGDTLEIWGTDQGVFSGQNALGGTVQEVGITAVYMVDVTTGYGVP